MADVPWYDQPMTTAETAVALQRTRRILEQMQAEHDATVRALDASGLTDFVERAEWLAAHRTPLESLAYEVKMARLAGWRLPRSLAVPRKRKPRRKAPQAIAPDRALEIAIAALEKRDGAKKGAA